MSDMQKKLQAELDRLCALYQLPGATAAVRNRVVEAAAAAGFSDVEATRDMQVGDRMLAASVGKLITAAVAVRCADAGPLDLDTPVSQWLGSATWWPKVLAEVPITLRQLLCHRSGLRDYPELPAFAQRATLQEDSEEAPWFTPQSLVVMSCEEGLLFSPGTLTVYSDTGYLLAGLAIEAAVGRPFYALADELILAPARMASTDANQTRRLAGLVQGYGASEGRFAAFDRVLDGHGSLRYHPRTEWTGGGFVSTAEDLRALVTYLFDGGLSAACVAQMIHGAYPIYDRIPPADYGLGVVITPTALGPSLGHTGSIPGYRALAAYYPVHRCSVALMINSDRPDWSMLHDARESLGLIAAHALT